jgi:hypothetical protein
MVSPPKVTVSVESTWMMLGAGDHSGLKKISDTLGARFKLTEKLNPTCITGVQIERVRGKNGWTKLHQTEYITNFLKEQGMEKAHPAIHRWIQDQQSY